MSVNANDTLEDGQALPRIQRTERASENLVPTRKYLVDSERQNTLAALHQAKNIEILKSLCSQREEQTEGSGIPSNIQSKITTLSSQPPKPDGNKQRSNSMETNVTTSRAGTT